MEFESAHDPLAAVGRELADGRYVLVRHLAEGGTAHVYLGYDTRTRGWRAIKTLLPEYASRPSVRHRFEREASTMQVLSHDNVISVYDAGTEGDTVYIVMEYAEGGSVVDWTDRHGAMPPQMATRVVIEVCRGIDAAHRQGIIHRDIKPQNLLVDRYSVCKVTDFGIAQAFDDARMTMTGTVMGTLGYMAPEQNESAKHADERADIYSIAATFYTLLKGEASSHLFMTDEQDFDGIPERLAGIVQKGTQYRRENRYGTVREMIAELENALEVLPPDPWDTPSLMPPDALRIDQLTPPGGSVHDGPPSLEGPRREWVIGVEPPVEPSLAPALRRTLPPPAPPEPEVDPRRYRALVWGIVASSIVVLGVALALVWNQETERLRGVRLDRCGDLENYAVAHLYVDVLQVCRRFEPMLDGGPELDDAYKRLQSAQNCLARQAEVRGIINVLEGQTLPHCRRQPPEATGGCDGMEDTVDGLRKRLIVLEALEDSLAIRTNRTSGGCRSPR